MSVPINNQTRLFLSVAAHPGNFGATLFNALFAHYGINAVYLPRTAPTAPDLANALRTLAIAGCSVSMPLKTAIIPHLDALSEEARLINSVNTITQNEGKLTGYNTDFHGCREVLRFLHSHRPVHSLLIYGAGSVVQSIVFAAKSLGIAHIFLHGRDAQRTRARAAALGVEFDEPHSSPQRCDLLLNATPSGDDPADAIRLLLPRCAGLFDLRVRPQASPLEEAATAQGLRTVPGVEMAKFQLQKQFELYAGILPPEALLQDLIQRSFLIPA